MQQINAFSTVGRCKTSKQTQSLEVKEEASPNADVLSDINSASKRGVDATTAKAEYQQQDGGDEWEDEEGSPNKEES